MKELTGFFVFLLVSIVSFCQQRIPSGQNYYDDNKGIVFNREFTVDVKLHTNGLSIGANIAQLKTYYLTRFINFEIGEIKHPKEVRQNFDVQPSLAGRVSRSFIFGKQNNFWVLRGGIGEKRYFSEKAKRKGLAIGVSYEAGPSIGMLKPYYLQFINYLDPGSNAFSYSSEKFSEENEDKFLDIVQIFGASGFSEGLGEITFQPGIHAKGALHFDWGAFDEFVKAIEAGIMVDMYFQKIPIMVESPRLENTENRSVFINLFLNFQFGKRW